MARGLDLARRLRLTDRGAQAPRRAPPSRSARSSVELVLIPQDLRTADPSLFAELSAGTLGLAGATVSIDGKSPFEIVPPTKLWQDALLGFGWLSDLRAANSEHADALAREMVQDWLLKDHAANAPDWSERVAARRLISWLCNAAMLTEGADAVSYDRFLAGCQYHLRRLGDRGDPDGGADGLTARIARVMGCLCLSGQDRVLQTALTGLRVEIARQILPSGGHVGRNPCAPVELLLDLLPLKQCFLAREVRPPDWLLGAMERMAAMLRHMQLGDLGLARFNGMGASEIDRLATVLAYHAGTVPPPDAVASSGYVRLSRRTTIVLVDGGKSPPREFSRGAHAGTLAFEMSAGAWPLIVNAGAPGPSAQQWRRRSRGTAAHSTLLLNDTASARLEGADDAFLLGPTSVEATFQELGDGSTEFRGTHNGYQPRYGMTHARVLKLSPQGDKLTGADRIYQVARAGDARSPGDLSYSIHFHTHPQARVRYGTDVGTAIITMPGDDVWTLHAYGSKLSLEDSLYFASFTGPTRTVQIVLRGHVLADTQIAWTIERGAPVPQPQLPDPAES